MTPLLAYALGILTVFVVAVGILTWFAIVDDGDDIEFGTRPDGER